ncbi:MAG TPA: Spy/CpxP family protein refolding chaperone [Terriglobales bacterium]|jgi:protein CpxP
MRTSTKWIVVSLAVVLVAAVAVSQTVRRAHARWGHGNFEQHMLGMMTDYLDLTDAQQAQVKQIFANEKPTIMPMVQQLAQAHQQMRQLEESAAFDEGKVRALASQQSQTITDLIVEKAKVKSQIFNILTPDQKVKAQKFMDRHEARMQRHLQVNPEQAPVQQ